MRHLKVVAAVAALALLIAPVFRSKPVLSSQTTLYIAENGDFKSIEAFDAWLVRAKRTAESSPILLMVKAGQGNWFKWLSGLDLKGNNLAVQVVLSDPRLSDGGLANAPHFESQQ